MSALPGRSAPRCGSRRRRTSSPPSLRCARRRGARPGAREDLLLRRAARPRRHRPGYRALPPAPRSRHRRARPGLGVPRRYRGAPAVTDLLSLTPAAARAALAAWLAARGEPAYRANQIVPRLWQRPVASWAEATDLPAPLRAVLQTDLPLTRLELGTQQVSQDGTEKVLWSLGGGEAGESA